ncbi:hypothetical protein [Pseudoroseicyclus sp. CXY001]|uniref:hypothetical protein n=1 Tax=Pseudoroseicyclus sp. CXY001 TaxID=3242492 RepID=UPI003570DFDD
MSGGEAADPLSAVPELLEGLRAERRKLLRWLGLAAAGTALVSVALFVLMGTEATPIVAVLLIAFGIYVALSDSRLRYARTHRLAPRLAAALGLRHSQTRADVPLFQSRGLVPKNAATVPLDDCISGELGGVSYAGYDLHLKSGGENKSTLFHGIIVTLSPVGPGAAFVAEGPASALPPGLIGSLMARMSSRPEGMEEAGEMELDGRPLPILTPGGAEPGFDVAAAVRAVAAELPEEAAFFRAHQAEGEATIAIVLHGGLIDLGGILASEAALARRMDSALVRMGLPAKIAGAWTSAQLPR